MMRQLGLFVLVFVLSSMAGLSKTFAEGPAMRGGGHSSHTLTASLSGGAAQFNSLSPSPDFTLNNGAAFTLEGEKPFGYLGLYLEAMLSYLHTTGTSNYNFTGTSVTYIQNKVGFGLDDIQAGFGLRLKILESTPVRPYIEGGITGGYFQISYDNSLKTTAVTSLGSDYRTYDGVLDFGFYGEAGVEIDISHAFGICLADHYAETSTRPIDTLKKQMVRYVANIYLLALFTHF